MISTIAPHQTTGYHDARLAHHTPRLEGRGFRQRSALGAGLGLAPGISQLCVN